MTCLAALSLLLFVPADRPDRYARAFAAGADAVVIDLEDAVAAGAKDRARTLLSHARDTVAAAACVPILRINPENGADHGHDIALLRALPFQAVMVPKVEAEATVRRVAEATGLPVLALIETARGLAASRAVAAGARLATGARLAFGSVDFAADLGCAHSREALLAARAELVLASRLADAAPPIDGVTVCIDDPEAVRDDAAYAASLGFAGKLLIHPAQVAPAAAGLRPSAAELAWAERVLAAGPDGGAVRIDGAMIDAPVRRRAEQIARRAQSRTAQPRISETT
jgi:citrate lyase subunit beta/citryl-CoA lyase